MFDIHDSESSSTLTNWIIIKYDFTNQLIVNKLLIFGRHVSSSHHRIMNYEYYIGVDCRVIK